MARRYNLNVNLQPRRLRESAMRDFLFRTESAAQPSPR